MSLSKKSKSGQEERVKLLQPLFGSQLKIVLAECKHLRSSEDDVLDAFAALWTAERITVGQAHYLPDAPQYDATGLRMQIAA